MDRSMINASGGTKKSTERAGTQSPTITDYIPEQLSSAQYSIQVPQKAGELRVKRAFAGSFDNTEYESRGGQTKQGSIKSSTAQNFRPAGKAPNTAGGIGLHKYLNAKQGKGQLATRTGNNFMRNFGRHHMRSGSNTEEDSFSGNSMAWRTNNLMQKAKKTLAEMNENSQVKQRAERSIATAGNQNVTSPLEGIEDVRIQIPRQVKADGIRHSVALPGTDGLQDSKFPSTQYSQHRKTAIEDSLIQSQTSRTSSHHVRDIMTQKSARRGQTIETRARVSYFTNDSVA